MSFRFPGILVSFSAIVLALACVVRPASLCAQDTGPTGQEATAALTGDQQSAANSALCSALGSHVSSGSVASPSLLSSPAVISTAATLFSGSAHLPLPSATNLLKSYVAQHASDILASCAGSNALGNPASRIPGAGSLPSVPGMP
jgi:hypothetical protein